MGRTYIRPDVEAPDVRPQQETNELQADTRVVVLFRGGPAIHDMYDSKDYTIPPRPADVSLDDWRATIHPASHHTLTYEVAVHLQNRAIVPGTRDPHNFKKVVSQIGIPNVDRADRCTPFTDEELEKFGYREGIDRSKFVDSRRDVTFVNTADALKETLVDVEGVLDAPPDADVVTPPSNHEGLADVRQAEGESGIKASRTRRGATKFDDEK
jgi:hypothetical protein